MGRFATGLGVAALAIALAAAVAGCGSSRRSILYKGVAPGGRPRIVISDAAAKNDVNHQVRDWRAWLATYKGSGEPPQLSPRQFRQRLAAAAARYHFAVKRVRFIRARALAPFVIVQTRHYLALARAIRAFWESVDPAPPRPCARKLGGTTACAPSEALFFEAQDERGVPFIAVGQGQWARSEELYPFVHG